MDLTGCGFGSRDHGLHKYAYFIRNFNVGENAGGSIYHEIYIIIKIYFYVGVLTKLIVST